MAERRNFSPLRAKLAVAFTLGTAALVSACGGQGEVKGVQPEATATGVREANPSPATIEPTATLVPTIAEPTATQVAPTETAEPEIVLTPEEITVLVNEALDTVPQTPDIDNIRENAKASEDGYYLIVVQMDPRYSLQAVANGYGSVGQRIGGLACQYPENQKLGEAWLAIRTFVKKYSEEKLQGIQTFIKGFFTPPADCPHPVLQQFAK